VAFGAGHVVFVGNQPGHRFPYRTEPRWHFRSLHGLGTLIGLIQFSCVIRAGLLVIPLALRGYSPQVRHLAMIFLFATPFLMFSGFPANILQGKLDSYLSIWSERLLPCSMPWAWAFSWC